MNKHKNRRFKRLHIGDSFEKDGKKYQAYVTAEDGSVHRVFAKTSKKWRKNRELLRRLGNRPV
jgi:hypothetical protein